MNSCYDMATASVDAANGGASNGSAANDNTFTADQEIGLNVHNDQRALHGAQVMTLSATLNADAQSYADQLAAGSASGHDTALLDQLQQGENLFQSCCNQPVDYSQATMMWYNEFNSPGYDFSDMGTWQSGAGHWSAVVWNSSTELGMGHAFDDAGNLYIVARYSPPGNMIGAFEQNVFQLVNAGGKKKRSVRSILDREDYDDLEKKKNKSGNLTCYATKFTEVTFLYKLLKPRPNYMKIILNIISAKKQKKQAAREEVSSTGERTVVEMSFNMNPLESISTGEPYMSPTNRITMGSQVMTQDVWPWMVELGFVGDSSATTVGQYPYTVEKRCTGTIIDTHWIVTAAYCCDGMEKVHLDFGVLERSTLGIIFTLNLIHFQILSEYFHIINKKFKVKIKKDMII